MWLPQISEVAKRCFSCKARISIKRQRAPLLQLIYGVFFPRVNFHSWAEDEMANNDRRVAERNRAPSSIWKAITLGGKIPNYLLSSKSKYRQEWNLLNWRHWAIFFAISYFPLKGTPQSKLSDCTLGKCSLRREMRIYMLRIKEICTYRETHTKRKRTLVLFPT